MARPMEPRPYYWVEVSVERKVEGESLPSRFESLWLRDGPQWGADATGVELLMKL